MINYVIATRHIHVCEKLNAYLVWLRHEWQHHFVPLIDSNSQQSTNISARDIHAQSKLILVFCFICAIKATTVCFSNGSISRKKKDEKYDRFCDKENGRDVISCNRQSSFFVY